MRNHRTTPTRNYTPLRNELIGDTRLSLGAHGLLDWLLHLDDGTPTDIKNIAAAFPDGQKAISGYFHELVNLGYVIRRRVRQWAEDIGRWVVRTVVEVYDIPQAVGSSEDLSTVIEQVVESLDGSSLEDTSPPPMGVKTGSKRGKTPPPVPPMQEPIPDLGGRAEPVIDESFAPCAAILRQIGQDDVRLYLSAEEMLPLLPLVAEWLARGATGGQVRQALTQGLPVPIYSAAKIIKDRLTRKLPPKRAVGQITPARPRLVECATCGRPTSGHCNHGAIKDSGRGLSEEAVREKARRVDELRTLLPVRS